MKALVCDRVGSLDDVRYGDVPEPVAGPEDVVVAVRAAAAVYTDVLFAEGRYQEHPPLPFVLGSEVAGDVVDVGTNVTRLRVGDRVMSLALHFGGFAERVVLPAWLPSLLPDAVPYEMGAAVMSSAGTAQHAFRQRAALRDGETIVVTGAAGGTGSAAVQVSKILGARVIAVCSSEDRGEFCRSLGADEVVVRSREDVTLALRQLTDGHGVDVGFDVVGGEVFNSCARAMGYNGRLLVVGFTSGHLPTMAVNRTLLQVFSVVGVHWLSFVRREPDHHAANMVELAAWLESGALRPAVTEVMPMVDGVSVLRRLAARDVLGKVVLIP